MPLRREDPARRAVPKMSLEALIPGYAVIMALLASAGLPFALVILSHGPTRVPSASGRILGAIALTFAAWFALLLAPHATGWNVVVTPGDTVAGLLLVSTASLIGYSAWALLAYGYTISMLAALASAGEPLTTEQWAAAYGSGQGLQAVLDDRLQVLVRLQLIVSNGESVRLSGAFARRFACLVRWCMIMLIGRRIQEK